MKERNMYTIIVSTCCCLWITMVQILDGKPYAGKRLSYEGMDWNFGGWTPMDGGGGGGFAGISSFAHHPTLTQHFSSPSSSSSPSLGLLNSNDPSSVMESDMIQFLKNVPSSVTPPPELHGLDLQTLSKQQQHHHQQQPSIMPQVNDSPSSSSSLRALRFIQQQSPIQHQPQVTSPPSWPSLLPVNSNTNNNNHPNNVSEIVPSSSSETFSASAPSSWSMSYAVAHDAPNKIRVEPKPLRQAQLAAYRVIEQLEADAEKQEQVLSAQGPTYLPLDIPSNSAESFNSQRQAMSYNVASNSGESSRESNSGYGNSNSLNNYNNQRHQTESHQTLDIPVKEIVEEIGKEIGKDYITLPVAVETDEHNVSQPVLSAQGPTYLSLDIPSNSDESYNSQGQAMSYNVASNSGESSMKSNSGYENSNSYNNQRPQMESHQTLNIPGKEIGKDYVTLPVETGEGKASQQVLSAQGQTYRPMDIPSVSYESYNSQGQAMSYNNQGQAMSYNMASNSGESSMKSNSGYGNSNSLNSYNNQRYQTESHQTLAIPVKEIGKDYVTLPVAVETDEDKVLTPQDISEIEKEVLKAIPESLGNPDIMYESAIPLDELSSPGQYMIQEALSNSYGGNNNDGGKTNSGGNRWPKIPKFMSALPPSKIKISDLLRPLLRKVRPGPLPPSPGHQLHGMSAAPGYGGGGSKGSNAPRIPAGTPYSNTGHRPENLDVIHLIAGPSANSYQPAVIHVSQLVRHKDRGPINGGKKKKMRNKKKSNINNNQGFDVENCYNMMRNTNYHVCEFITRVTSGLRRSRL